MARLVSSWYKNVKNMPEEYIFPPDKKPGKFITACTENNPVIDLASLDHDPAATIQQLTKACQEFGFFQVINHGVSEIIIDDTSNVYKEFFDLPSEEKAKYLSVDPKSHCRLYTSTYNYATEEKHFWRDNLTHSCYPLEDCMQFWPEKPIRYKEIVGAYSAEVRKLVLKILDLICDVLGVEKGYFSEELSGVNLLSVNHYPPCPDPTSALGMHSHCDPNLITILHQGTIHGLQVLKDGQWIWAEPLPHAFVVILGCQMQIISNDKFKSAEHRVVTNSEEARTSLGTFVLPSPECYVEIAKSATKASNPQRYKSYRYKDFIGTYGDKSGNHKEVLSSYYLP
ncbi:oxygenase [Lithospermum erythrorhizon]|uniref:Oxygenase n=1 Tax=Lithospermum erythrorhizon TaxID=34254 RepID=A0AAV3P275_LITER